MPQQQAHDGSAGMDRPTRVVRIQVPQLHQERAVDVRRRDVVQAAELFGCREVVVADEPVHEAHGLVVRRVEAGKPVHCLGQRHYAGHEIRHVQHRKGDGNQRACEAIPSQSSGVAERASLLVCVPMLNLDMPRYTIACSNQLDQRCWAPARTQQQHQPGSRHLLAMRQSPWSRAGSTSRS